MTAALRALNDRTLLRDVSLNDLQEEARRRDCEIVSNVLWKQMVAERGEMKDQLRELLLEVDKLRKPPWWRR